MESIQVGWQDSRSYSALAIVLLAATLGVGLALVVLLTNAKPAHAIGETMVRDE